MEKQKKLFNPFTSRMDAYEGQKDFDQYYKSIKIIDVVKKTGEGEDDYIIEKKVIEDLQPIKDVIEADRDSVGVENIIKQVLRTGDTSLLPVDKGNEFVDLVGAPENLMELKELGKKAEKDFEALPIELKGDLDMAAFVNSMSQEKFDAFVKALQDRASQKKEVKENE